MQDTNVVNSPPKVIHIVQKDIYVMVGNAIYLLNSDVCEKIYAYPGGLFIHAIVQEDIIYINVHIREGNVFQAFHINDRVVLWSYTTYSLFASSHRVAHDFVYVCAEKRVLALHRSDGKPIWSCDIDTSLSPLSIVKDSTIYVVSYGEKNFLYAINTSNGVVRWRTPLAFIPAKKSIAPLVGLETVILCTKFGCAAFSSSDGLPIWHYQDAPIVSMIGVGDGKICLGYPLQKNPQVKQIDSQTHILFEKKQCVCLLREDDGALLWKSERDEEEKKIKANVLTSPIIANGIAYVVLSEANGSSLVAFQVDSGLLLWRYQVEEALFSTPCVEGHIVYIGSNDGYVSALHTENGAFLWKTFVTTTYRSEIGSERLKFA
jgi:outer membrane protein assembly factor BamB